MYPRWWPNQKECSSGGFKRDWTDCGPNRGMLGIPHRSLPFMIHYYLSTTRAISIKRTLEWPFYNGVLYRNNILLHCSTIVVPGLRFPATTTVEFQQHPGKEVRGGMPPVAPRALLAVPL